MRENFFGDFFSIAGQKHQLLDFIIQLAYIAGPAEINENLADLAVQSDRGIILGKEMRKQQWNIILTFAQGRNFQTHGGKPIE